VVGRYRALLIGNSTYPADEHNLQALKGPVKDIAVLNRALIDPGTGLFADVDVTLLPEATSARAIRALGRFFGTAARDDVLLVYFSGHGKLDQSGRLHLCMQDTESVDLLSTAVSSARIKEFADASHARNVIIVLDCCYAGAFRGGDLGEAVAGPGRYVLTSCRGTQLANDATVENGTSVFTQHLVDGLLGAAADQDGDGYVTFSDLYAYVDRRLREAGKQIPQRRVDGDGDVPLAKRPRPAPSEAGATAPPLVHTATATHLGQPQEQPADGQPPGYGVPGHGGTVNGTAPTTAGPRPSRARWGVLLAVAIAVVTIVGGVITVSLLSGNSGGHPGSSGTPGASLNTYTASGPWRLTLINDISGSGSGSCTITLTDAHSGQTVLHQAALYGRTMYQVQAGSYRWTTNNSGCKVMEFPGAGMQTLSFTWDQSGGDTDAFTAPSMVAVQVPANEAGQYCIFTLYNLAVPHPGGTQLDQKTATPGNNGKVVLNPSGAKEVYLNATNGCTFRVSPA
jgi:Caspase domain